MFKKLSVPCSAASLLALALQCKAAMITVNLDSGAGGNAKTVFDFNGTTPLTGGTSADGNGAVLQLGYFNAATSANPFAGSWIALTGQGGANSAYSTTSIGDLFANGNPGDGRFALSLVFDTTIVGQNASLPAAGMPLGIRIYNNTTIASSTRYATFSNSATGWQWATPTDPPGSPSLNLSLANTGMRREDGTSAGAATTTFTTNLTPVPEPSTLTFGVITALAAAGFRQRRRK